MRGREAEAVAGVGTGGRPAAGDVVAIDDLFVDGHVDVGEGAVELAIQRRCQGSEIGEQKSRIAKSHLTLTR